MDAATAAVQRRRLVGLDGVRGLAALFVVLHHVYLRSFPGYPRVTAPMWAAWMIFGHFAVVVFIVLSGFSLAVSPARAGWQLGPVSQFGHRRAWRILPPFWAALVFSLLVAWLIVPQPGTDVPNANSVVVNGLLLQDVFDAPSPNRAFWSIAVEAHLYLVFPLLLLIIRRVNAAVMLATVTLIVATVGALAPDTSWAGWLMRLTPQFAVLFAMGILAAGIVAASERVRSWPWHWFALAAALPVMVGIGWKGSAWILGPHLFWVDLALAPAVACLLAAVATDRPAPLVGVLDTRPVRSLGTFSYSLYLTHAPIVVVINELVIRGRYEQGVPSFLVSLLITVPVTVVFARLFAGVFEIPFQRHRSWHALRSAYARAISGMRATLVPRHAPPARTPATDRAAWPRPESPGT